MLKIIFLFLMAGGIPVAIAMAGSSLLYIWWTGNLPGFVVIHRMVSGIDSFPLLRDTLRSAGLEDTVVPIVSRSTVAVRNWATPLSLVFIDGGHSYETALTDYKNWSPHLLQGGVLAFHDIYLDPSRGGQAPRQVYEKALASGDFDALPMVNTLGILKKRYVVVVEKKVCC